MKPIKKKWTIQIEVTNACANECVNCSRFVGHHKKPYYMDLAVVERALDSLQGFRGGIGIMGGEPTLHPNFAAICDLMKRKVPPHKRLLWTAGYNWNKFEEIIRNTFGNNVIYNDHNDKTQKHHPMLLSISDVVKDTEYMKKLLDKCWVDQRWSASINPKGCFFCEIAAALDMLFEGPGGHPIERGWWEKGPEEFIGQQERYCRQCGACVPFVPVTLEDRHDIVSESNFRKLTYIDSPKLQQNKVKVIKGRYSEQHISAAAENWQPWNHLGIRGIEGTRKYRSKGVRFL